MEELWPVNLGNAGLSESGGWPVPSKLQNLLHTAQVNSVKSQLSKTLMGSASIYRTRLCWGRNDVRDEGERVAAVT